MLRSLSATPSYNDTDVATGVSHAYKVSAVNRDGYEGPLSNAFVLAMPGIVRYEVTDTTHIVLTFSKPLHPATATAISNYTFVGGTLAGVQLDGRAGEH